MKNSGDLIFNNVYFFNNDNIQNFIFSLQSKVALNKSYFNLDGTNFNDLIIMINSSFLIENSFFMNFKSSLFVFYHECKFELVKSVFKQKIKKSSLSNSLLIGQTIIMLVVNLCFFSQIIFEGSGSVI